MQGRRRVAWEPGSRNATALPCPPVFRPSARVRWSNCRSWCPPPPGPWLLARRLGEARRPVAALAWCWISGRTARRRSGRCASRRVEVFDSEPDLRSAPLGTARCVREGELLGARGVRLGAEETSRSLGARVRGLPLGGIQQGELVGDAWVFDSVPGKRVASFGGGGVGAGSGVVPLGGVQEGALLGRSRCSTSVPDLQPAPLGTARCVREGEFLGARGVRNPLGRMRGFDPAFGVDQRVGVASRWSTCSTLTWDSPLLPQTTRLRLSAVRTRSSSTSSRSAASGRSSSTGSPQCPFFVASSSA